MLRSKNATYRGYDFLALEVRVPADGLSKSSNWCYDYQYLCEDIHRRPTSCSASWGYQLACRDNYNSDMDIGLQCYPANEIAVLANIAFPNLSPPAHRHNAFGFYLCGSNNCDKTIHGSTNALVYMSDFWQANVTTFYTVCQWHHIFLL